ncbi:unnamed protein product [Lupinus luteus]|uniref:Uncharacterized protein n=1 Tax=Lupinus luteus TaxID=3873 RepID=A0AAV1YHG5_LUPLU
MLAKVIPESAEQGVQSTNSYLTLRWKSGVANHVALSSPIFSGEFPSSNGGSIDEGGNHEYNRTGSMISEYLTCEKEMHTVEKEIKETKETEKKRNGKHYKIGLLNLFAKRAQKRNNGGGAYKLQLK